MSKKKTKKNADTKPAAAPAEPNPLRVTCETCGMEYDAGAPHAAFCRGTRETECEECGNEMSDEVSVAKCRECDKVFCSDCGNTDERKCYDCEG